MKNEEKKKHYAPPLLRKLGGVKPYFGSLSRGSFPWERLSLRGLPGALCRHRLLRLRLFLLERGDQRERWMKMVEIYGNIRHPQTPATWPLLHRNSRTKRLATRGLFRSSWEITLVWQVGILQIRSATVLYPWGVGAVLLEWVTIYYLRLDFAGLEWRVGFAAWL